MGINVNVSSCSTRTSSSCLVRTSDEQDPPAPRVGDNPDPRQFTVVFRQVIKRFLIARVTYAGCTNYEGSKVLVFEGVTPEQLDALRVLDPHFCDDTSHPSPVARFEPTSRGWNYAIHFCSNA